MKRCSTWHEQRVMRKVVSLNWLSLWTGGKSQHALLTPNEERVAMNQKVWRKSNVTIWHMRLPSSLWAIRHSVDSLFYWCLAYYEDLSKLNSLFLTSKLSVQYVAIFVKQKENMRRNRNRSWYLFFFGKCFMSARLLSGVL